MIEAKTQKNVQLVVMTAVDAARSSIAPGALRDRGARLQVRTRIQIRRVDTVDRPQIQARVNMRFTAHREGLLTVYENPLAARSLGGETPIPGLLTLRRPNLSHSNQIGRIQQPERI
jgi:hypothetical protein